MHALGLGAQASATLDTFTLDVLKSSEIEGEVPPAEQGWAALAE